MVRYHSESRPIATAIRQDPQYLAFSDYAMQLTPFLERFGRDRIAVLTHEQLVGNPYAAMDELYRWLGLDLAGVDAGAFREPENVTPEALLMPVWNGIPRRLWRSPLGQGLRRHLPRTLQARLRAAANRSVRRQDVDLTQVVAFLRSVQGPRVDALSDLLGRGFPEWSTLNGRGGGAPGGRVWLRPLAHG
jgi:hypothetical protein